MDLLQFVSTVSLLSIALIQCAASQGPVVQAPPQPDTPTNEELDPKEMTYSLWELLRPWRGFAMICFWAIVVTGIVVAVSAKYCSCMKDGRPIARILRRRGKYSNYNFVSVYSETEAEIPQFCDDYDSDKLAEDRFDEISIIK